MRASRLAALAACVASAAFAAEPTPCESRPESRQLDFWLGEWTVMDAGQAVAASRIEKAASGCVILESYTQADGFSGKSINFFDPLLGKWRQTWADSRGNASEFTGEYRDKALTVLEQSHANGNKDFYTTRNDADLIAIRGDPRFQKVLELEKKVKKSP